jgi:uracil-DNA glycosylase
MKAAILDDFVEKLRLTRSDQRDVPSFEPNNGNLNAKVLLVLEAPGPGALKTGKVSQYNDDPTAKNLKAMLEDAKLKGEDLMIWNVVPWYCGNEEKTNIGRPLAADVTAGIESLCELTGLLPNLKAIVLVGGSARKAHVRLSATTQARILSCHHMSQRVINRNNAAEKDNEAVFTFLGRTVA